MWTVGSSPPPPLSLAGDFPDYQQGVDYEGRIDIVNSIGACTVELLSGELPTGYQLFVDQAAKQVVLRWPGFTEVEPVTEIPNGDFQQGQAGWQLPAGWAVESYEKPDITPTPAPGNLAAVCRALGRGDHVMDSERYPCAPGASVSASGLWDQGPSNKDNVNLFTGVAFFDENGNELAEFLGNRIHDETNKQRHVSSVTGAIAPFGTASAALRNIVHRRNSRNREVIVDDCQWNLTFMSEVAAGDYCLTLIVRDSASRQALWDGCISEQTLIAGMWWRILIEDSVNPGDYIALGEVEMREFPGGPTLCGNGLDTSGSTDEGFAYASSAYDHNHVPSAAVDGNINSPLRAWVHGQQYQTERPQWWVFRFKDFKVLQELAIWPQASLPGRSPARFRVQTCTSSDTYYPPDTLRARVDNFDWFDVATFDNVDGWTSGSEKVFPLQWL